ncbi:3-hydroxyacyl-CoA dehydrogenase [Coralliovum pocilloporae]|uniref:3-hydroxyacyl-CoA dehydrogenase n=1 Tax=Coralliovum pocilloporae TaxID=3066369 RepID=UPI003307B4A9
MISIAIIGAGTMGSGISIGAASSGNQIYLIDESDAALDTALRKADTVLARWVEKERLSEEDAKAARARMKTGVLEEVIPRVDLVIEAVFEDLTLKQTLLRRIDPLLKSSAIVATNTSCLKVADLAGSLSRPERFLGLHYFSPAEVNPLCELVRGPQTLDEVAETALAFLKSTGKQPLQCRDSSGFAVNRFFCPYTNEAARLVDEELAEPAEVDRVCRDVFGAAAGPFLVMNIIKPRINLNAIRNLSTLGRFYEPADGMIRTGDADQFWTIEEGDDTPGPNDAAIADRMVGATCLAVLQLLDEGVASPQDIDMGASMALKFGIPPCTLMDNWGQDRIRAAVEPICKAYDLPVPDTLERVGRLFT